MLAVRLGVNGVVQDINRARKEAKGNKDSRQEQDLMEGVKLVAKERRREHKEILDPLPRPQEPGEARKSGFALGMVSSSKRDPTFSSFARFFRPRPLVMI